VPKGWQVMVMVPKNLEEVKVWPYLLPQSIFFRLCTPLGPNISPCI